MFWKDLVIFMQNILSCLAVETLRGFGPFLVKMAEGATELYDFVCQNFNVRFQDAWSRLEPKQS